VQSTTEPALALLRSLRLPILGGRSLPRDGDEEDADLSRPWVCASG
jgi:hypothetical protein